MKGIRADTVTITAQLEKNTEAPNRKLINEFARRVTMFDGFELESVTIARRAGENVVMEAEGTHPLPEEILVDEVYGKESARNWCVKKNGVPLA
jgi:hypothetical protein